MSLEIREQLFTRGEICERLNISMETWKSYVKRSYAPKPDFYIERTPVWLKTTIEEWHKNRVRARKV